MTDNSQQHPHRSSQPSAYNPITWDDLQRPVSSANQGLLALLLAPASKWAALPFFGFVCFFSQRRPFLAPLLVLILLSCLLMRLEENTRKVVAAPLALSTIKLAFGLASQTVESFWLNPPAHRSDDACFLWLPIFFSTCLALIPYRESITFKIVLVASYVLLASGLLPGAGFVAIFYMLDYLLFVGILIGLFIDLIAYSSTRMNRNLAGAQ